MIDRFHTLDGLKNEIYTLIYNYDILNFQSNLKTINEIHENEDFETLEKIMKASKELFRLHENKLKKSNHNYENKDYKTFSNIVYQAFEPIKLYQYKKSIINFLEVKETDIQNTLNEIKTLDECERVYQALISSEHITSLPKGYSIAKKDKVKARKRKMKKKNRNFIPSSYEQALRRNRRFLEDDLRELGVIQKRAQKISSLLEYL